MGIKMKEFFQRSKNITQTLPRLIRSKFPEKHNFMRVMPVQMCTKKKILI